MASLVRLDCYDPELRDYLSKHKYPTIIEALMTGLSVMMPHDPWDFVLEKLQQLKEGGESILLHWDMFVDASMKPHLHHRGMLDALLDETDLPTEEMFEKSFTFRKNKLLRWAFNAWMQYHVIEQKENEAYHQRIIFAKQFFVTKTRRAIFRKWRYSARKARYRESAFNKMVTVCSGYMLRLLFTAWLEDYKVARRARRWFHEHGGGEGVESEEETEWYWDDGDDPISSLPRNIAIKIFGLVGIQGLCWCARVCRNWKDITEDGQLWNKLDFYPIKDLVSDSVISRLLIKYRPLLGHLSLRGCSQLTPDCLKHIGQCQNLQDLNLSECTGVNDEVIEQVAKGCSGLLYLNLSHCFVTDSIIRTLTKYCVSLHYLSLAYSPHFTSKGLKSITSGKGCRRLVFLDLSGCTTLSAEGMLFIGKGCPILNTLLLDDIPECDDSVVLKLVAHCHTLRHISFMGSSKLTDRAFKYLAMENRKLRSIKIENNSSISDVTLRAIGKACRELTLLYIAGCCRVSDHGLKGLASLKKLQVLNIADCNRISDAGVRFVIESNLGAQLRELNLTNCSKLSDVTILRMSQRRSLKEWRKSLGTSCKSLTYVCFCYCEHISDTGVELLGHIPTLTSVDLSGCDIRDYGVAGLRKNPNIRDISLAEIADLTDDGLQKMTSTLSKLESLDISECEQITDTGVRDVAFNCRMMRTFLLANCHRVTDEGTRFISQACPYLTQLDISGCSITDRSLRHLRKHSSSLTRLDILYCVQITREAVLKLKIKEVNYNTDRPPNYTDRTLTELPVESLIDRI